MKLEFCAELSPKLFSEIGTPTDGFINEDGKYLALCSEFPLLFWPGRAMYEGHRLKHRVSLYERDNLKLVRVFDAAKYQINDLAFHPSKPLIAIATGSYDGGYHFEGEIILWNWQSGETTSLLGESREILGCRFLGENQLAIIMHPPDEGDFESNAFCTFFGLILNDFCSALQAGYLLDAENQNSSCKTYDARLVDLKPIDPADFGFSEDELLSENGQKRFFEALGDSVKWEERGRIWDVCWISDNQIAAVHEKCYLEVWNRHGERELFEAGQGFGIQLLNHPKGIVVNVFQPPKFQTNTTEGSPGKSSLVIYDGNSSTVVRSFDHAYVFSVDRFGNILCRDPGDFLRLNRVRNDLLLNYEFQTVQTLDLGYYDCFNSYIRLDGSDELYYLSGTPPESHENKQLFRIDVNGSIEKVMNWDKSDLHLLNGIACLDSENSIIRAFRVHYYDPNNLEVRIERNCLISNRVFWSCVVTSLVTSMSLIEDKILVFTLTDGKIGLINTLEGKIVFEEELKINGISTMALSTSVNGLDIAIGAIDGRILVFKLVK
ncbi:MAG: hypothetical protein CVV27_01510 [Candidatus Melainabacteria bacterium HGW-Melainabacteria-1]|nr:MAG: hypothetical protein CVV27_01510 [Candidatus Melainabacteria bacterium HGW-Melainabacteria-1]